MISHEEAQQQMQLPQQTTLVHAYYSSKASTSKASHPPSFHAGKAAPTPQNTRKRPTPPTEPFYYKSGRQVNTKYYYFHCSTLEHSDERCYDLHGYLQGHKLHKGNNTSTQQNIVTPTSQTANVSSKPQGSANYVATSQGWSAWSDRRESYDRKKEKKKKRKEFLDEESEEEEEKKLEMGFHGFPLYSNKYNPRPRPIPKSQGMENSIPGKLHNMPYQIVDSGILEHLCGNAYLFTSIHCCEEVSISLPNRVEANCFLNG